MSFLVELPKKMPPWWQGDNVRTLVEAYGQALDQNAQVILDGRRQGIVWAGGSDVQRTTAARLSDGRLLECDPWVIQVHADQRGMRIYPTEPELSQRIRTALHLVLKAQRGSPYGEIEHMRPYFTLAPAFPVIRIVSQTGDGHAYWRTIDASGKRSLHRADNFNYDGQTSKWSRWWAFVEMDGTGYTSPITYGSGHTYGDGSYYGQGGANPFTAAQAADIAAMLIDWSAAHSRCTGIALVWGGSIDVTASPTQDADGRWSLPNGPNTWSVLADPGTGKATRPANFEWIWDPGPG